MGQRHQIYVRLAAKDYGKNNPNTRGESIIGVHHQWCYGSLPLRGLRSFKQFWDASMTGTLPGNPFTHQFGEETACLAAILGCRLEEGYFHGLHEFKASDSSDAACLADPRKGDNNDGITVIDVANGKVSYCFVFLGWADPKVAKARHLKPLTAKQYLNTYYKAGADDRPKDADALLASLADLPVITPKRLREIFPAMFRDAE